MSTTSVLLQVISGYKTYAAAILMVVAGVGSILAKHYNTDVADHLQSLAVIYAGVAIVSLRHAIAKVPMGVLDEARTCN
jgi:hypothetical protein